MLTITEKVNAIIGPSSAAKADTIAALIEMCTDEAIQFCNLELYTVKLDNAIVQMVVERFNRLKNEGVRTTQASDISDTFIDGYSQSTLSMLKKCRKIRRIK